MEEEIAPAAAEDEAEAAPAAAETAEGGTAEGG